MNSAANFTRADFAFPSPPRVAVIGTGAIGGYYGARLAQAGADVHFLLRSDYTAVQRSGLRVQWPDGQAHLHPLQAAQDSAAIGPVDIVLIGLKATANAELPRLLPPLLHAGTTVVNLQNGLGVDEPVIALSGAARYVGALCFICVVRSAPGVIDCTLSGSLSFAEAAGPAQPRTRALAALFADAGVQTQVLDSLLEARWRKLFWNVPFNGLAVAHGGISTRDILDDDTIRSEAVALMQEVRAIAAAEGVAIAEPLIVRQIETTRAMSAYLPSSAVDFLAGRPVEIDSLWREPLHRAQRRGVPAPRLQALLAAIEQRCAARPVQS